MWSSARRTLSSSKSISGFHSSPGFIHPFRSRDSCSHALGSFPVPAPAAASSPNEPITSDTKRACPAPRKASIALAFGQPRGR